MAQLGYGITNNKLKELGAELAQTLGIKSNAKPLSNCWLTGFLQRWKEYVSSVKSSALETNRAKSAIPVEVDRYFENLKMVIKENGLSDKPNSYTILT
ncbi:hypothetical protein DPMN_119753 [Dreissena polymorpha]|uniref:HTH CENPB-type domain-containing protein n=1 Tax=Dreissena polymorpha TaxID=45954 RepID=A0A9D4GJT9_DREPO|nr:hypothetical protein DPMN_119753 [Dreissena polymorpha]